MIEIKFEERKKNLNPENDPFFQDEYVKTNLDRVIKRRKEYCNSFIIKAWNFSFCKIKRFQVKEYENYREAFNSLDWIDQAFMVMFNKDMNRQRQGQGRKRKLQF